MTDDDATPAGDGAIGADDAARGSDGSDGVVEEPPLREVPLAAGGPVLRIRRLRAGDERALSELYEGLPAEDRRLRFFSAAYRPTPSILARWVGVAARGGCGLVAEVDGRFVAHACYEPLPDGNAELAMTVAPGSRGWLGPYLLDTLVEEAAARRVPGLEAEVLTENRRMLAVLRARGYAVLRRPDWSIVRLVIGTGERVPGWPGPHDRPRILVEGVSGSWPAEDAARRAGFDVMSCPGPAAEPPSYCPALRGEPCPLVTGADVVVVATPSEALAEELTAAHARLRVETPVVVQGRATPSSDVPVLAPGARAADVVNLLALLLSPGGDEDVDPPRP